MLDQIEIQIPSYSSWVTVGIYNVKHIPRIGEYVSVTGNIEKGYFGGIVTSVRHDLDTGYIYVRIGT